MTARVVTVSVGTCGTLEYHGRTVASAFVKTPVAGAVATVTGLAGDEQADREHHGGPDKALCVYAREHYPWWERTHIGRRLATPAFGENLTTAGVLEGDVCIGDVLELDEALVQVSQPRQPCFKLAARHGVRDLARRVRESGRTGWYLRVLEEGRVRAGRELRLVRRPHPDLTIAAANRVMHASPDDVDAAARLLVPELSASWRAKLEHRLELAAKRAGNP